MKIFLNLILAIFAAVFVPNAFAAIELPNNISAAIGTLTTFDATTGLYTYKYSITNYGGSPKVAHEFYISLRGATVLNIVAPAGWESSLNKSQTLVGWCACSESGFVPPPGYVNDGRGIPSKYAVAPGATLGGFSFQSPYPPSLGQFYVGGWVPVPVEGVDFAEGQEPVTPDFPLNLLVGSVEGPLKNDAIYTGGRRPAVDGFLVFLNIRSGEAYTRPVIVDILFSQNGETVEKSSLKALLNGIDVTASFKAIDTNDVNRRRAVFEITATSPLKIGKNILTTSVNGTVPSSGQQSTDTDKVVFIVQ